MILVSGGADSGKSAFAERLVCQLSLSEKLPPLEKLTQLEKPAPSEKLSPSENGSRRLYIATMEPHGPEAAARIARHREQRRGMGFLTVERYTDLAGLAVPGNSTVLLEDLGNLCANELFSPCGGGKRGAVQPAETAERQPGDTFHQANGAVRHTGNAVRHTVVTRAEASILGGISHLRAACQHLVLVSNEVFLGGGGCAGDTDSWLRLLARVNRHAAALAEGVCEVVCGVPCWYRVPGEQQALPPIFREGYSLRGIPLPPDCPDTASNNRTKGRRPMLCGY